MKLRLLLSLLCPALILWVAGWFLTLPSPWMPTEKVLQMEAAAKKGPYDVVVVGPSIAGSDIHPALLGRSLGPDYQRVLVLAQEGSTAPSWYAMLKERAYKNGVRPKVVVVSGVLNGMLTTWLEPSRREAVTRNMPQPDEVLLRKTWASPWPSNLERALERRARLRDPVVLLFRLLIPSLYLSSLENQKERVDQAGLAVFGDRHEGAGRVLPGVEDEDAFTPSSWMELDPSESLLVDMAALARENGAILLVALPPIRASQQRLHQLSPEGERRLVASLNALGIGLVDLRSEPFGEAMFRDGLHMNAQGQQRFTTLLAEHMLALGLKDGHFLPVVEPLEPVAVRRLGSPPPIPIRSADLWKEPCSQGVELRRQDQLTPQEDPCKSSYLLIDERVVVSGAMPAGEVSVGWDPTVPITTIWGSRQYWVLPEGALEWSFDRRWGVEGPYRAELSAIYVGEGEGKLVVGEQEVPLEQVLDRWEASVEVDPQGSWNIQVKSSKDHLILVRSLVLMRGSQKVVLVQEGRPTAVSLLGAGYQVEGRLPELGEGELEREGELVSIPAPWNNVLGCSPLRVYADGQPMDRERKDFYLSKRPREGGMVHLADRLWFRPSGAQRYRAGYDPDRLCWSAPTHLWLYPGDRLSQDISVTLRSRMRSALRRLDLRVRANVPPPEGGSLQLRLIVDGRLHFQARVAVDTTEENSSFAVEPPIPAGASVQVEILGNLEVPVLVGLMGREG